MTFFRPRIAAHVVTAVAPFFPVSGAIVFHEFDTANPFGTLPGIQSGDDESDGVAVVRREVVAVMFQCKQAVIIEEVGDGQIRAKTIFAMDHHKSGLGRNRDVFQQFERGKSFPEVVEFAPTRDAVHIGKDFDPGQCLKLRPRKCFDVIHQRLGKEREVPFEWNEWRNFTGVQHRPFIGLDLTRGNPVRAILRPLCRAGHGAA